MKNREKYAEYIKNFNGGDFCKEFVKPIILKSKNCPSYRCSNCNMIQSLWLDEEYVEPEPQVDWSKVTVDTPIFVRNSEDEKWKSRHFGKYVEGVVYAYDDGRTSHTGSIITAWSYAKLAEVEE